MRDILKDWNKIKSIMRYPFENKHEILHLMAKIIKIINNDYNCCICYHDCKMYNKLEKEIEELNATIEYTILEIDHHIISSWEHLDLTTIKKMLEGL